MKRFWLGTACAVACLASGVAVSRQPDVERSHRRHFDETPLAASVGDVVFFCTTTWRGRVVRMLESGKDDFTHVGIIVGRGARGYKIVHASPTTGTVRVEDLTDLLSLEEISCVAVYHPRVTEIAAGRAAKIALAYASARTSFDHEFRFDEDGAVYCTELIWLSYRDSGLKIAASERIVVPSDLVQSGFFIPGQRLSL